MKKKIVIWEKRLIFNFHPVKNKINIKLSVMEVIRMFQFLQKKVEYPIIVQNFKKSKTLPLDR